MFCENCGKEITDDLKFCPGCGESLKKEEPPVNVEETIVDEVPVEEASGSVAEAAPVNDAPGPTVEDSPGPVPEEKSVPEPPEEDTKPADVPPPKPESEESGKKKVKQRKYDKKSNLVRPLSTASYVGIFILMAIPVLNLILLLVWSIGDSVNLNKRNFARAVLIMAVIVFLIAVAIGVLTAVLGAGFYRFRF